MRTAVPHIVLALALGAMHRERFQMAVDMVELGSKLRATELVEWWRWSVWLAAGITVSRI